MRLAKRTNLSITILLILFGVTCVLVLPGLPVGRAAAAPRAASQKVPSSGLDSSRQAALEKLYAQFKSGAPFSEEESVILNRFGAGVTLTDLEADVVISRALFDYYISGKELTKEQHELLERYSLSVARRSTDVADLKTQLLNKRIAAAAAAPPRTTPLVAPANDLCGGAEVIPPAGPFPYLTAVTADITDATTTGDPPLPSCQNNISRSIWYTFTPSATARYKISTCTSDGASTTLDDTVMAIYTSAVLCTAPFTEIPTSGTSDGCDDDSCVSEALQAVITTQLNGGTRYYIVVWQFDTPPPTAGNTAVQLRVSQLVPPGNDTCAGAIALSINTPTNGTTEVAANDYQLSGAGCFTGVGQTASTAPGGDVVYSFMAPAAANYSFKVTNYDANKNLVLYVATTCPAATPGTPVTVGTCLAAANRQSAATSEEVNCVALSSGQQVFIFVDESPETLGSTFTIEVSQCVRETEANDTPATANAFVFGIEGTINPGADADFFSLGSPAAASRLFAIIDGVAGFSTDFDLRVTTSTDTLEYDDFNNDPPFGVLAGNVAGTPLTGAPTFLRVNQINSVPTEPYRLYAVAQPPIASATGESEPNNTILTADSAANNYFTGSLAGPAPSTDVDFFSFTANSGDLIFLSLDCDPIRDATPINGELALLDSAGTQLISVSNADSNSSTTSGAGSLTATTPFSPAEGLLWRARTTGTYYAKVLIGPNSSVAAGAGDYLLSISRNGGVGPQAARFSNDSPNAVRATRYADGVSIIWRTGFEVDNLGFNVYREEDGKRNRVNSQIISGSALIVGPGTALGAGRSYAWFDNIAAGANAQYWIEALDLDGESSWYGPVSTSSVTGKTETVNQASSATLGQLGKSNPLVSQTTRVDRRAEIRTMSASGVAIQGVIAGQAAAKLGVKSEGLYVVTQPELAAAGFNTNVDPRNLRLFVDGKEQPINVIGQGKFDASAAVEFYGIGVDSAVTDERVYWLAAGAQAGQRIRQIWVPSGLGASRSFLSTVELKERSLYFSALRNGDKENFFGAVVARDPVDQALTLQHVDTAATGAAMIEVALQGVTLTAHRVEVQINGSRAGEVVFKGQDAGVARLPIAQSLLREGTNIVRLVAPGGGPDVSLVDCVRLTYWHTFVADNNQLRFNAPGKQVVNVDGFTNAAVRVFDVTNPNSPQEILGAIKPSKSGYSVTLNVPGRGLRTLLALTSDSAKRASNIKLDQPSNWRQPVNAANLVIFTRRDFIMALDSLKALRQSQGYKVAIVDIEDVYDEFSYGNKTPLAIKEFLAYARGNWKIAPRFVLLAGDASYDPKNYLGFGDNDLVPTRLIDTQLMETASDDWLADLDGDGLAEMAVGRLPIRSAREAASLAGKIVGYDRAAWPEGVLLVADDAFDGVNFEVASNELRSMIPKDQRVEQINRGSLDPASARSRLLDAINRGQRVINYNGHGNADAWRAGLLTAEDANSLVNGDNLSLFIMMTCLNGYFADAQIDSLGESLVKAGKGGAVAVWASSGMALASDQGVMDVEMFRRLFDAGNSLTLGEIAVQAKAKGLNKDARLTWVLLGDPTTRFR